MTTAQAMAQIQLAVIKPPMTPVAIVARIAQARASEGPLEGRHVACCPGAAGGGVRALEYCHGDAGPGRAVRWLVGFQRPVVTGAAVWLRSAVAVDSRHEGLSSLALVFDHEFG
jgi:hypothetical protein